MEKYYICIFYIVPGIIQIPSVSVTAAPATPQQVVQTTTTTAASPTPQTITIPSNVPQGNIVMVLFFNNLFYSFFLHEREIFFISRLEIF